LRKRRGEGEGREGKGKGEEGEERKEIPIKDSSLAIKETLKNSCTNNDPLGFFAMPERLVSRWRPTKSPEIGSESWVSI
jgi:hypothetical protein